MALFTIDQAEALLPQLREHLLIIQACKRELDALRADLAEVGQITGANGHVSDESALTAKRRRAERLVDEMNQGLARINGWGVELKGVDEGLVDFPSERDGRVVYLCWRLGEERIAWWHEMDLRFAGRQPL
jgi:hypothetical protein